MNVDSPSYSEPVILENLTIICGKCGYQLEGSKKFEFHQVNSLKCNKCELQLENEESLKKHKDNEHIILRVYNCLPCNYKTTEAHEYKIHVDTKHRSVKVDLAETKDSDQDKNRDIRQIQCNRCDYKCNFNIQLRKHIKKKHENVSRAFHCKVCSFTCGNSKYLEEHTKNLHSPSNVPCESCDFQASDEKLLTEHNKSFHHSEEFSQYFLCDECELKTAASQENSPWGP